MDGHSRSSSSKAGRSQVSQQVPGGDLYSTIGDISGGIMRFNLSDYNQRAGVDHARVQPKRASQRVLQKDHSGQVAPNVKDESSSPNQ